MNKCLIPSIYLMTMMVATAGEIPTISPTMPIMQGQCRDNDTKLEGYCILRRDMDGNYWTLFVYEGKPAFLRKSKPDGSPYEQVWTADDFNSF